MRKLIAILCVFAMLFSLLLASCGSDKPAEDSKEESSVPADDSSAADESKTEPVSETTDDPYRDENGVYVNKNQLPFKEEWKDRKEFRVLVYNNNVQTTYFSEEIESLYETTDDKIREAVDMRNREIEDKYGITVKAVAVDNVVTSLRTSLAADPICDAAMPFMSGVVAFAEDGNLYDLCEFEGYLDIYAPWWDQNANESLSIAHKIYFSTGDISIMQRIVSNGIAFNKKLMANYYPDVNMYELVDSGEWTIDKLYEMSKAVTHQVEDDGVMDEHDFWGCLGGGAALYFGSGEMVMGKDANDYPIVTIGKSERTVNVAQKALTYANEKGTWTVNVSDFSDQTDKWNKTVQMFGEDQVLFYCFAFSALKKFRPYDVTYGIVPIPKYETEQEGYYCRCSNLAYGVCIPENVENAEFSAYMLDLMAAGGKNYLTKAYYDATLKGKDMNTLDDERMLDIIFSGIHYDLAHVYNILDGVFSVSSPDQFVSNLQSILPAAESKIEEIIERYESN